MKKTILIGVIALMTNNIMAQEIEPDCRDNMMVGLKAGINSSNAYDISGLNVTTDPIPRFTGGGFINIPFIKKEFAVQTELMYSQKGFKAMGNMAGDNYEFTRKSQFVDVPILLAFMPNQFLSLLAGIQYTYLISQMDVFNSGPVNIEQQATFNSQDSRKNGFGIVAGFDINYSKFVFSARGGWDMLDNNGYNTAGTLNYKNMLYQATIGYRVNVRNNCGNDDEGDY